MNLLFENRVKELYSWRFGLTGPYGPVPGLDVQRKMVNIEKKNADIVIAMASIFDEDSGYFSPQKAVEIKRHEYST